MTISVRVDRELERALDADARARGVSRSEVVRQCLERSLREAAQRRTPWSVGATLFGRQGSGRGDLALNRKQILREKLRGPKSRH